MDKAIAALSTLAAHLGETTAHLWPQFVLYTRAGAIGDLVSIAALAFAIKKFLGFVDALIKEDDDMNGKHGAAIIIGLGLAFLAAVVFFSMSNIIGSLVAPEGAAVHEILKTLSGHSS